MEIIQARLRERARHSLGSFRLQRREVTEPHDGFLRQHPASAIAGLRDPWWAGRIPGYGAAHPPPSWPLSGLHNGGVSNVYVGGGGVDGRRRAASRAYGRSSKARDEGTMAQGPSSCQPGRPLHG